MSPYTSKDEVRNLELENDKINWVSKNNFNAYSKSSMPKNEIKNYVGLQQMGNVVNFNFRDENKNKWVVKKNFTKY